MTFFFSLSASILYIVNSSAQHETPIPLNFIEQLNKIFWSSKKKTNHKYEYKKQFCKPILWVYARIPGCTRSPPYSIGAGYLFLTHYSQISTGDHLVSCVAPITAAVCLHRQASVRKHSMCPKPGLQRKKLIFAGSMAVVARRIVKSSWFVHDFCHGNVLWQGIGLRLLSLH